MNPNLSGFLNVFKPAGITSHDVIYKLRQWTKIKRIGHAGTLDPAAIGVLPIAIGSVSRLIPYLPDSKIYLAEIKLGIRTTTDDLCGSVIAQQDVSSSINKTQIESVLNNFIGQIEQKPPLYSAVHKDGKRLYDLARQQLENKNQPLSQSEAMKIINNMSADVQTRSINIEKIELLQIQLPVIQLRIYCSSGTYIRSLARDIGEIIGCGGSLQSLCREQAGFFTLDKAIPLTTVQAFIESSKLQEMLIAPETVFRACTIFVNLSEATLLTQGRNLAIDTMSLSSLASNISENQMPSHCLASYQDSTGHCHTIAYCSITENNIIQPKTVLPFLKDQ